MRVKSVAAAIVLALMSLSTGALAQAVTGKVLHVVYLAPVASPAAVAARDGLAAMLVQRGFGPDRATVELKSAEGKSERLPAVAKGIAAAGADVIVTTGFPAARAVKEATSTIPIVATNAGDPVETGLAASLNRPGGNVTGISDMAPELSAKRLDLLKSAVPGLKKVAMLWNADDLGMTTRYHAAAGAAATLGVAVMPLGVREPDDFASAFAAMDRDKPDGILMVTDILTILNRKRVFEYAAAHRLPAIYEFDFLAKDGGLMAYGPDGKEVGARVADLVERILKGEKPADLPFEQPAHFVFVINKKTADTLGIALPETLLARADDVVE
jgi:putative ABC transport system substrate-binding protein